MYPRKESENTYMENWKMFFELKCTTRVCYNVGKVTEFLGGDDFLKCIHVVLYFIWNSVYSNRITITYSLSAFSLSFVLVSIDDRYHVHRRRKKTIICFNDTISVSMAVSFLFSLDFLADLDTLSLEFFFHQNGNAYCLLSYEMHRTINLMVFIVLNQNHNESLHSFSRISILFIVVFIIISLT